MYKVETREKWPSGPRMLQHQAKRIILDNLLSVNKYNLTLTNKKAAAMFHSVISCRPMYSKLIYEVYSLTNLNK